MSTHARASGEGVGAVPIHPRILQWALATAVALTVGIAGASFWLSFAALSELSAMAGNGSRQAWVIPVVLDGAIVSTTVTAIALSNHTDERTIRGRRFVMMILRVSAAASIAGNSYHAVLNATLLPAVVSAGIATIAPIALLAMTEVLAVILRAPRHTDEPIGYARNESSPVVSDRESKGDEWMRRPQQAVDHATLFEPAELGAAASPVPEGGPLPPEVIETVRLRHSHPEWSWARIGEETDGSVASTAMRRYRRWESVGMEHEQASGE